ncbi:MAG: tripartite tricarboxylate transporter substrate-binding protein, partial [Pseudolabrys sp.]
TWNMMAAPPKTPTAVLKKLNRAIDEILKMPDVKARFAAIHTSTEGGSLADAKKYVAADRARWKQVIEKAGIKPE